jgi:hypothetical protein
VLWPFDQKRLDLALERSSITAVKRRPKNFIVFVFAAIFAFGILCSTFAAPGQALASVSGCSQTAGAMAMAGCGHPSYLCGFDSSSNLLAHGALSSTRANESLKNALDLAFGAPPIDISIVLAAQKAGQWKNGSLPESAKVPVHLFNSVLNL